MRGLSPDIALRWAVLLSSGAIILASSELWAVRSHFQGTGLLAPHVLGEIQRSDPRTPAKGSGFRLIEAPFPALLGAQIVGASLSIVVIAATGASPGRPGSELALWMIVSLSTLANLALQARMPAGQDGADQMASIVLVACTVGLIPNAPTAVTKSAVWFIALQACLSYVTAGAAKVISAEWRSGDAIRLVFRTESYGNRRVMQMLQRHKLVSKLLCYAVIAGELLFPLGVLLGGPWLLAFLAWGLVFHLSVAALMRLNTFALAFPATYVALIYVGY